LVVVFTASKCGNGRRSLSREMVEDLNVELAVAGINPANGLGTDFDK
jgi:dihydroxyacetone kinase DhaKLM complex PTS-EIIA-like component DhaM